MGDQLGRDVLEARGDVLGGAAPALRRGGRSRRRAARPPELLLHRREEVERLAERLVAGAPSRPPARAPRRTRPGRARRAAAPRSRRASCRRCARSRIRPRPWPARPRRRAASSVTSPAIGGPPAWPGSVSASTSWLALERRQHQLPRAPRVGEAVQADERRPGPPRWIGVKVTSTPRRLRRGATARGDQRDARELETRRRLVGRDRLLQPGTQCQRRVGRAATRAAWRAGPASADVRVHHSSNDAGTQRHVDLADGDVREARRAAGRRPAGRRSSSENGPGTPGGGIGSPSCALTASKTTPSHGLRSRGPQTATAARPPGRSTRRISPRRPRRDRRRTSGPRGTARRRTTRPARRCCSRSSSRVLTLASPRAAARAAAIAVISGDDVGQHDLAARPHQRRRRDADAAGPAGQLEHPLARLRRRSARASLAVTSAARAST